MGSKIDFVKETEAGDINLKAIYNEEDDKPRFSKVIDRRSMSSNGKPTQLRLQYDEKKNELGLIRIELNDSDRDAERLDQVIDTEIEELIHEAYGDEVEIRRWRTHQRIIEITGRKFGKYIQRIRDKVR